MKISVVIPFYNRSEYLERTLSTIVRQEYPVDSLILVDNCSSDDSCVVAENFLKRHPQVSAQLIRCDKPGAAAARNAGLQRVTTDYVYFFDSDDEMSPHFLAEAADCIADAACDLLVCRTSILFEDGRTHVRDYGFSHMPSHQISTAFLSTQSMVIRTDYLRKCGGWNESLFYWNDWELGVRLLLGSPAVKFMENKIYHTIHAHKDSITGNAYSAHVEDMLKAFQAVRDDILAGPETYRRKSLAALVKRQCIMAGTVRREGDRKGACRILQHVETDSVSQGTRLLGRLLYRYTALGGRGAWRL